MVSKVEPKGVPGCCHVVILQFCEGALLAAHAGAASEDGQRGYATVALQAIRLALCIRR